MRNCSHNCELLEPEQTPDQQKLVWHQETLCVEGLLHSCSSHKLYKRLLLLLFLFNIYLYCRGTQRPTLGRVPAVFWSECTQQYSLP